MSATLAQVSRDQLRQKVESGGQFVLVDALAPMSFAHSHLPGAINLPPEWVDERGPRRIPDLDTEIVVYCSSSTCDSSVVVGQRLLELGYRRVSHYVGGKRDWVEAGFPLEGGGVQLRIDGDGVELAVLDEGDGAPVLLLHGFPDSSKLWRHQISALTGAGLRAIAPDLRGFGESDRPEAVEDYAMARSVADMVAVLDALGVERAHVVGHDWGAGLAWALAAFVPERVERLVVMSVGHPNTIREPSIEQREKAWYQLLFQFEGAAEELIQRDDWKLFREMLGSASDCERYIEDLSRPGALTAGLNWYRANARPDQELERTRPFPAVGAPTMGIWSSGDNFLLEEGMLGSGEHVTGPWRYERLEGAGHWLQLDAPERINELLLEFLT